MNISTKQARELFGEWAKETRLSPETTRKYRRMMDRHIKACGGSGFDTDRTEETVKALRSCDFSEDYVRSNRSFLNRFTAFIDGNCKRTVETEQIELPTEEQPNAERARQTLNPEAAAHIRKIVKRASKRAEIMKQFDGIAATAIMNAVAVLTSTCKARTQELYNRKANINWNAEDWQTASSETATLFRNKREFEKVIAALEAVLDMKAEEAEE